MTPSTDVARLHCCNDGVGAPVLIDSEQEIDRNRSTRWLLTRQRERIHRFFRWHLRCPLSR